MRIILRSTGDTFFPLALSLVLADTHFPKQTSLTAANESTFYLAFEFLITDWFCRLEKLRYVFNAQWRIDPRESTPGSSPIAAPTPDLTIGFEEAYLTGGSIISRPVNDSAPVIRMRPSYRVSHWTSQNLHNSAVMLRTLRTLWIQSHGQTGLDENVHAVTVSIDRHFVEAFVHWTGVDEFGDIKYHHAPIQSWCLGAGGTEWVKVRSGIKSLVEWVTDENEGWIMNALRNIRGGLTLLFAMLETRRISTPANHPQTPIH